MSRIFVALDNMSMADCLELCSVLGSGPDGVKIQELADLFGFKASERLRAKGVRSIFCDPKLHDTPSAVQRRARAIAEAGADFITVHTCEGIPMIEAALESVRQARSKAEIWGVTVLTSSQMWWTPYVGKRLGQIMLNLVTLRRALTAKAAGVQGVTCSVRSAPLLSTHPRLVGMKIVTPGIRGKNEQTHDHLQFGTVMEAVYGGATDLVIGRPITKAEDQLAAFKAVMHENLVAMRRKEEQSMRGR
jgi:orotidine-5'-phosphate decarboxylase